MQKLKNFPAGLLILIVGIVLGSTHAFFIFRNARNTAPLLPVPKDAKILILGVLDPLAVDLSFFTPEGESGISEPVAVADIFRFKIAPGECPGKIFAMAHSSSFPRIDFDQWRNSNGKSLSDWFDSKNGLSHIQVWSGITDSAMNFYEGMAKEIAESCPASQFKIIHFFKNSNVICSFNANAYQTFISKVKMRNVLIAPNELREVLDNNTRYQTNKKENRLKVLFSGDFSACRPLPQEYLKFLPVMKDLP